MYGSPISSLPAQMISWTESGADIGAAARPFTYRAVVPGTSSWGRVVGPFALPIPAGGTSSGCCPVAAGSLPPVAALAVVPVVPVAVGEYGITWPLVVFTYTGPL